MKLFSSDGPQRQRFGAGTSSRLGSQLWSLIEATEPGAIL